MKEIEKQIADLETLLVGLKEEERDAIDARQRVEYEIMQIKMHSELVRFDEKH